MRASIWLAVLVATLGAGSVARAQQAQQFNTSMGTNVINPTFKGTNVPGPTTGAMTMYSAPSKLFNWLPKIQLFNSKSQINTSAFPQDKDMPGMKYLNNFGFHYAKPAK